MSKELTMRVMISLDKEKRRDPSIATLCWFSSHERLAPELHHS